MSEVATAVPAAAPADGETFDVGEHIMHHILDSNTIEVPFTSYEIPLPRIHVGRYDLSITRNVVMMWIACAILLTLLTATPSWAVRTSLPSIWRSKQRLLAASRLSSTTRMRRVVAAAPWGASAAPFGSSWSAATGRVTRNSLPLPSPALRASSVPS